MTRRRTLPELIEDAVGEILLRIPPDSSAYLARASMVCKLWRRVVSDPDFTRRYREFHRLTPLLLGFFHNSDDGGPLFYPTMPACPFPQPRLDCSRWLTLDDDRRLWALDCRHGRVLLCHRDTLNLLVWDPITGSRVEVPGQDIPYVLYAAMVLCAVAGCDHCDCPGGPFLVVFVGTFEGSVHGYVYSSKAGAWGTSVDLGSGYELDPKRGVLIGAHTYFTLRMPAKILKYDLGKDSLSVINLPAG
ncbi:unnamed protein product [Urochloa decumbens]|uniref:F-box domain-containing protein n=1 Tax=Urochloa decumbens TaxID=240449 RepID=A0ABC9GCW3_9POAL